MSAAGDSVKIRCPHCGVVWTYAMPDDREEIDCAHCGKRTARIQLETIRIPGTWQPRRRGLRAVPDDTTD